MSDPETTVASRATSALPPSPEFEAALIAAQSSVLAVSKDATNQYHGYKYASAESVIDEGRKALNSAGLALRQVRYEVEYLTKTILCGKEYSNYMLHILYRLSHKSGHVEEWFRPWPVLESPGRPIDKAFGGALTTCLSYTIRDTLLIPRDDDQAAMDRRGPPDEERTNAPKAETSQRSQPAQRQEAARQEAPKEPEPPLARVLELIRARANDGGFAVPYTDVCAEIDKAFSESDEKVTIRFLAEAYREQNLDKFLAICGGARDVIQNEKYCVWALKVLSVRHKELAEKKAQSSRPNGAPAPQSEVSK